MGAIPIGLFFWDFWRYWHKALTTEDTKVHKGKYIATGRGFCRLCCGFREAINRRLSPTEPAFLLAICLRTVDLWALCVFSERLIGHNRTPQPRLDSGLLSPGTSARLACILQLVKRLRVSLAFRYPKT